jgi:hypothetical protein
MIGVRPKPPVRSGAPPDTDEPLQRREQRRTLCSELPQRIEGKLSQDGLTRRPQLHQDLPPIGALPAPCHHSPSDEPIHQLNGAVVLELQPVGEDPDCRRSLPLESFQLEQEQILLRLDAGRARRDFPAAEKPADLVAELRERPIVSLPRGTGACARSCNHSPIIYRPTIYCRKDVVEPRQRGARVRSPIDVGIEDGDR